MKQVLVFLFVGFFLFLPKFSNAGASKEFIDINKPEEFIVEHFDLRSIRSSFGPKRISGQSNFFKNFGLKPNRIEDSIISFDEEDWFYEIRILDIKDENDDGFLDFVICFKDQAKQGTYKTISPHLLTRYNDSMPLISIGYEVLDERCRPVGGD